MRKALLVVSLLLPCLVLAQTEQAKLVVEVTQGGKPVSVASVTIDDGTKRQDALIDPDAKGDAPFESVKLGPIKVTVAYRVGGKPAKPVTQLFEKADVASGHLAIALPDAPGTPTTSVPPPAVPTAPAPVPAPSGGFNFVGTLFALVIGGGAAAGIWYFIKQNPGKVGGTLERLGAQIPKPLDDPLADPPVAPAPAPVAPEPPQKIVLDPAPSPISVAPVSLGSTGEPSLVSDAGVPIPLAEGETTVGREIGLGLSLSGETTVSRRHARLVRSGSAVTLEDEGSTNGTFVNGTRVAGAVPLNPGDAVQFGSVRFRYEG